MALNNIADDKSYKRLQELETNENLLEEERHRLNILKPAYSLESIKSDLSSLAKEIYTLVDNEGNNIASETNRRRLREIIEQLEVNVRRMHKNETVDDQEREQLIAQIEQIDLEIGKIKVQRQQIKDQAALALLYSNNYGSLCFYSPEIKEFVCGRDLSKHKYVDFRDFFSLWGGFGTLETWSNPGYKVARMIDSLVEYEKPISASDWPEELLTWEGTLKRVKNLPMQLKDETL